MASVNDDVHVEGSLHEEYMRNFYGKIPLGHRVFFNVGTGKRTVEYIGLFPWGMCADCGQPSKFMIVEMQSETEIKTRAPHYKTWLYCGVCQVGG